MLNRLTRRGIILGLGAAALIAVVIGYNNLRDNISELVEDKFATMNVDLANSTGRFPEVTYNPTTNEYILPTGNRIQREDIDSLCELYEILGNLEIREPELR